MTPEKRLTSSELKKKLIKGKKTTKRLEKKGKVKEISEKKEKVEKKEENGGTRRGKKEKQK